MRFTFTLITSNCEFFIHSCLHHLLGGKLKYLELVEQQNIIIYYCCTSPLQGVRQLKLSCIIQINSEVDSWEPIYQTQRISQDKNDKQM